MHKQRALAHRYATFSLRYLSDSIGQYRTVKSSKFYWDRFELNERQKEAIKYVKDKRSITRREYMEINKVSNKTAYLELNELTGKKIFNRIGVGKATKYILR